MTETAMDVEDIRRVLIEAIGRETGEAPEALPMQHTFTELGVDSIMALAVAMDLEDEFGLVDLPPTLLWEYPTVDTLAPVLLELLAGRPAADRSGAE
jgi:acyl carrier protein